MRVLILLLVCSSACRGNYPDVGESDCPDDIPADAQVLRGDDAISRHRDMTSVGDLVICDMRSPHTFSKLVTARSIFISALGFASPTLEFSELQIAEDIVIRTNNWQVSLPKLSTARSIRNLDQSFAEFDLPALQQVELIEHQTGALLVPVLERARTVTAPTGLFAPQLREVDTLEAEVHDEDNPLASLESVTDTIRLRTHGAYNAPRTLPVLLRARVLAISGTSQPGISLPLLAEAEQLAVFETTSVEWIDVPNLTALKRLTLRDNRVLQVAEVERLIEQTQPQSMDTTNAVNPDFWPDQ